MYDRSFKKIADISMEVLDKQASYMRQILLMASGLFGILIALHGKTADITFHQNSIHVREWFASAILLLATGILSGSISLYTEVDYRKRACKALSDELSEAIRERRMVEDLKVPPRKIFVFCEAASYISLLLSVVCLALYSVL